MRLRRIAAAAALLGLTTLALGACADQTKSEGGGPNSVVDLPKG